MQHLYFMLLCFISVNQNLISSNHSSSYLVFYLKTWVNVCVCVRSVLGYLNNQRWHRAKVKSVESFNIFHRCSVAEWINIKQEMKLTQAENRAYDHRFDASVTEMSCHSMYIKYIICKRNILNNTFKVSIFKYIICKINILNNTFKVSLTLGCILFFSACVCAQSRCVMQGSLVGLCVLLEGQHAQPNLSYTDIWYYCEDFSVAHNAQSPLVSWCSD